MPRPVGRRPVLLLTRSPAYAYLNKLIVAEITTTVRNIPQEVRLGRPEGMSEPSVVNLDKIHVVPKSVLGERVGELAVERQREVKRALGYALGWPEHKTLQRVPAIESPRGSYQARMIGESTLSASQRLRSVRLGPVISCPMSNSR